MPSDPGHRPEDLPPGLLEDYLRGARAQILMIGALADRLAVAGDDAHALDQFRREVHKVHGSAGSYGFWEASELAAEMEATAKQWLARPAGDHADRGAIAQLFVSRLAAALRLG